ncbi:MAG: transketolase C-terminal domain-containing protein [bacterium]|nr:transketolase C-terminal domain-containing protein [bacterium]
MAKVSDEIDTKVINNIKALAIDMVNNQSRYKEISLDKVPIIYRLYNKHLNIDPKNPDFINQDRFIISDESTKEILYATLFMSGFPISIEDLKIFSNIKNKEFLGVNLVTRKEHSLAISVGLSIAEVYLNAKYKYLKQSLIDYYTYALVSEDDLMGVSYEILQFASDLKLGKLIILYFRENKQNEDLLKRFEILNWDIHQVNDPYNLEQLDQEIEKAKQVVNKPSIIEIKRLKRIANKDKIIFEKEEIVKLKKKLGIRDVEYTVLSEAYNYMKESVDERRNAYINKYEKVKEKLSKKLSKEKIDSYKRIEKNDGRVDIKKDLTKLNIKSLDTASEISNKIINKINKDILLVGDNTDIYYEKDKEFSSRYKEGRNINIKGFLSGIVANGVAQLGLKTIINAPLSSVNYMMPSIEMSILMEQNLIYLFIQDEENKDEINQIDMLRLIPKVLVFTPADKNEIIGVYKYALLSKRTCVIILQNGKIKPVKHSSIKISDGAYILKESENDELCIISSGANIQVALKVSETLEKHMIKSRVVSMPSISLFCEQNRERQEKILPSNMKKVVIELSSYESYYKFLNKEDLIINIKEYQIGENEQNDITLISNITNKILKLK